jgi:hypothetical protein
MGQAARDGMGESRRERHRDGAGLPKLPRGIYPMDNPQGILPQTNLLILRLGFNM